MNTLLLPFKVTKKMIAFNIFSQLRMKEELEGSIRQNFFKDFMETASASRACANTYYDMANRHISRGDDEYRYHAHRKHLYVTVEKVEDVEQTVSVPADAKWYAEKDDKIEYFSNRTAARTYAKENGGGWNVEKVEEAA